jgi:hypothetical protein
MVPTTVSKSLPKPLATLVPQALTNNPIDPDRFDGFDLSRAFCARHPRPKHLDNGRLAPFHKAGPGPPMPQQPRADDADDQDHSGADQRRHGDAEMAEGKAVIDRPDRLAGKERRGMQRQRCAARGLR